MVDVYYVYQLRRADRQDPFYIGMGRGDRMYQHLDGRDGNPTTHKNHTIKKALGEGVEVLAECLKSGLSKDDALRLEIELIAMWGRADKGLGPLTNLTDGGESPDSQSSYWLPERKEAKSKEVKEYFDRHPEAREINRQRTIQQFLKPGAREAASERTKAQMAESGMIEKLSDIKKRQWQDPEFRNKILESRKTQKLHTCEHCGKEGLIAGMYKRWHGDNCRNNVNGRY